MARILIVDDEPTLLALMSRFVSSLDHEVSTAADGRDALRILDDDDIDLLITDINMPDIDGIEILNELRRRRLEMPVIAMSGGGLLAKELLLDTASVLGAVVTLQKPFELNELERVLEELLGHPS